MKNLKEKVSVVMPAHNEGEHIQVSIRETAQAFIDFGCAWELIVIDDGSTDNTFELASAMRAEYPHHLIIKKNPVNLGKGRALKRACRYVSGEYVMFLDADLDLHPNQAQTLFDIMRLQNADVVIGSKLHPNSTVQYPLHRRIVSMGYYYLVKILFHLPCHDTQTGLKLFKAEIIRKVFPRILVKKFAFDLELLVNAHHLGYKIVEAPIVLTPRRKYGRIGTFAVWVTLRDTLAIFYRLYILKYYDRIDYHRRKNMAEQFGKMRRTMSGA